MYQNKFHTMRITQGYFLNDIEWLHHLGSEVFFVGTPDFCHPTNLLKCYRSTMTQIVRLKGVFYFVLYLFGPYFYSCGYVWPQGDLCQNGLLNNYFQLRGFELLIYNLAIMPKIVRHLRRPLIGCPKWHLRYSLLDYHFSYGTNDNLEIRLKKTRNLIVFTIQGIRERVWVAEKQGVNCPAPGSGLLITSKIYTQRNELLNLTKLKQIWIAFTLFRLN